MIGAIASHYVASGGATGYSAEVLADSPLAYWRLGDASGTAAADSSGNSRTATYRNSPTLAVAGATTDGDTAVTFDGVDDDARLAPATWVPKVSSDWSFDLWLKFTTTTLTVPFVIRAEDGLTAGVTTLVATGRVAGQLSVEVVDNSNTGNRIAVPGTQNDGAWHHLAATFAVATNTFTAYFDGASVGSVTRTGTANTTNRSVRIGANVSGTGSTQFFPGSVDEVAIYGTALSAARIAAHYAAR